MLRSQLFASACRFPSDFPLFPPDFHIFLPPIWPRCPGPLHLLNVSYFHYAPVDQDIDIFIARCQAGSFLLYYFARMFSHFSPCFWWVNISTINRIKVFINCLLLNPSKYWASNLVIQGGKLSSQQRAYWKIR